MNQDLSQWLDQEEDGWRSVLMIFGSFQGLTIGFAMFVSPLKPWRQRRQPATA